MMYKKLLFIFSLLSLILNNNCSTSRKNSSDIEADGDSDSDSDGDTDSDSDSDMDSDSDSDSDYDTDGDSDEDFDIIFNSDASDNTCTEQIYSYSVQHGFFRGVFIQNNYAYIVGSNDIDGKVGFHIFDISNPSQPIQVSFLELSSHGYDIYIEGQYAYVANDYDGLLIINVEDVNNPQIVGSYNTIGRTNKVQVIENYAYLAEGREDNIQNSEGGLRIIDISNKTNPAEISFLRPDYDSESDTGACTRYFFVENGLAYISCGMYGLRIVDVLDPNNPHVVGSYNLPDNREVNDIYIQDNYAYFTAEDGLHVLNISNSARPQEIAFYETSYPFRILNVTGDYIYTSVSGWMHILKIENLTTFKLVAFYNSSSGQIYDISVKNEYIYIINGGFQIVSLTCN